MKSPLGAYAETVAAFVAVLTVAAAIISRPLNFQDPFLDTIAGLSLGAIFGSTATANGVKTGQAVLIEKLDTAAVVARATVASAAAPMEAERTADATERTADATETLARKEDSK